MILAAGLGERIRPLTDRTPKPLLKVGGVPLIEHHLRRLAQAGYRELVINVSHLARQIVEFCGDGSRWGLAIDYSPEAEPLETAGGICKALPLLGNRPFLVVNGDIWTDYPFAALAGYCPPGRSLAHLVMVDSPPRHPLGDFALDGAGCLRELAPGTVGLTYSGVGVYTPEFFAGLEPVKAPLRPLLDAAIREVRLTGEHYRGRWEDVGTPASLQALDRAERHARHPE